MSYLLKNVKNQVLASKQEYCTWDYGTREPDYADHHGIDLINNAGGTCDVIAVADGEVVYVQDGVPGHDERVYTAGNFVRIRHENGMYSRYLHMVNGSIKVKIGQKVKAGTVLGHEGETGYSFGIHLHFDVNDGKNYVDPLPYLLGQKSFYKNTSSKKNTTNSTATSVVKTLTTGTKVALNKASLYGSATTNTKANTITGTYYIHSNGIINNRIRITTPKGNSICTGWVKTSDCKVSNAPTSTGNKNNHSSTVKPKPTTKKLTTEQVALKVIRGDYGCGEERKKKLTAEGYDYSKVQAKVNEILYK